MQQHSTIGPSAAPRWVNCPGSVQLIRSHTLPKEKSSVYAEEGTAAHELLEDMIAYLSGHPQGSKLKGIPKKELAGAFIGETYNEFVVTEEMFDAVYSAVCEIYDLLKRIKKKWTDVTTEQKLTIPSVSEECFGTVDILIHSGASLYVLDYKHGRGVLVNSDTEQLRLYAIGAIDSIGWGNIRRIHLGILQPRHPEYRGLDLVSLSAKQLKREAAFYREKAEEALNSPYPSFRATPKGCRWCPVSAYCPVAKKVILDALEQDFDGFDSETGNEGQEPNTSLLSQNLELVQMVRDWANAVEKQATALACNGEKIPGYKLVHGRSIRRWALKEDKLVEKLKELGLDDEVIFEKKIRSIPQIEKQGVKLDSGLVFKPEGKLTLVPESDKRPEAVLDLDSEFSGF